MYITKKTIETDLFTGLEKDIRIVSFTVNAPKELITVEYTINLVSPTGIIMVELERNTFTRYNGVEKTRYNDLKNSQLGQGIIQMLNTDLDTFPNFSQE